MSLGLEGLGWLLLLVSLYLLVRCSNAKAEPPCRRDGASVVCTEPGFKVLTDKLVDLQTDLGSCQRGLRDAQGRMTSCREECPLLSPPASPEVVPAGSPTKAVSGAALVAVGAASVVLATTLSQVGGDWRAGLATLGVAGLSIGVVLVLP